MDDDGCTLDTDGDKIADYKVSKSFIYIIIGVLLYFLFLYISVFYCYIYIYIYTYKMHIRIGSLYWMLPEGDYWKYYMACNSYWSKCLFTVF